jgi:hypothetical protein
MSMPKKFPIFVMLLFQQNVQVTILPKCMDFAQLPLQSTYHI